MKTLKDEYPNTYFQMGIFIVFSACLNAFAKLLIFSSFAK